MEKDPLLYHSTAKLIFQKWKKDEKVTCKVYVGWQNFISADSFQEKEVIWKQEISQNQ